MTTFLSDIILNNENDIQFKNSAGSNAGKISQTGNDLVLSNDQGDILLGDGASDVYIGDGTNSVDILFEQSGSIKADDNASGVTITLGSNNTNIAFGGAVSFGGGVTAFSAASANTVDLGASATPFLNLYAAHHVGGNSINYATSRGWVEDGVPMASNAPGFFGGNFTRNGADDENAIVRGQDCFNNKALLWKAIAHDTDDDADGGWNKTMTIPANNNIGYLSYVYFMADFTADSSSAGTRDGTIYLGCGSTSGQTLNLNGTNNTNPYFVSQSLFTVNNGSPAVANRWYLMVGVIQPYNDETTGTDTISGVYDVETGQKVLSGSEFKMGNNTTTQMHRTYLYYDESGDADENVYFWNPGFHAIDGSEPKLQDLLKRQTIANTVKVGRDGHNLIDFTTDNQIDFRVADGNRLRLTQTALAPITTDTVSLGTSSLNFSDLFLDSGGVVNFDNGDVTLTHSGNNLAIAGGNLEFTGYGFVMDGVTITSVDNDNEFTDDNSHIMTSAAIQDKILSYNYTTNTGDFVQGNNLSAGNINFTGELNFTGNGAKYIDVYTLANSNDFTIRHHNETGNLFENAFKSTANGATYLYHDGNTKLTTKSDGVDITGELQSDTLDVDGNADISGSLTLGQALAVGDGGTGVTSNTIWLNANSFANFASSSADWDTVTTRGLYRLTGSTNNPFGSSHATGFTLTQGSGDYGFQLFSIGSANNSEQLMYRYRGTSFGDWQTIVTKTFGDGRYLKLSGSTMTGDLVVDGGNITIDTDAAGSSLAWKESDSSTLAGQLRGYANRGDIYLYKDGVKLTELSPGSDSFIPALHIGGTAAASDGVLQTTGNVNIDGNADISGTLVLGAHTLSHDSGKVAFNSRVSGSTPTGTTDFTTKAYVDLQVSNLVNSAPSTLDTLNELAEALGDDANFSTTVTNSIATKLPLVGGDLTGKITITTTTDNKIDLIVPSSGDTSDWNYIQFKGADGVRDAYFGTTNDGTPSWYRDDGATQLRLDSTKVYSNSMLQVNGELEATSLDINGNADISGTLTVNGADAITIPDYILHDGDNSKFGFPSDDNFKIRLAGNDVFTMSETAMAFTGGVTFDGTLTHARTQGTVTESALSGTATASALLTTNYTYTSTNSNGTYARQDFLNLAGSGGSFQNVAGYQMKTNVTSTGTSTAVKNILSRVHTASSGDINNVANFVTHNEFGGSGNVGSWAGLAIADLGGGFENTQTVTNTYGIKIGDITHGTQTNAPYAIHTGTERVYFGGQVGIGTDPAAGIKLHVNGDIRVDSTDGVATRLIRSNYFSSSSDIEVRSGASGNIILGDGTARLTIASDDTATFTGDVKATDGSDTATLKFSGLVLSRSNSYIQSNADNSDTLNIGQSSVRWGHVKVDSATFKVLNGGNERFGIDSSGNTTFAKSVTVDDGAHVGLTITGSGTSHTQGAILLKSGTSDTPEARGQGVYLFNEGDDATWYTGTQYQDADTWMVARKAGTSFDSSAATNAQSFLKISNAGAATFASTIATSGNITATASNATISAAESGGATTKIMGASVGRVGTSSNHNLEVLSNNTAAITIDTSQNATFAGDITVGVDDTGHDVIFYGATSGKHMHWDEDSNGGRLNLNGGADLYINQGHMHMSQGSYYFKNATDGTQRHGFVADEEYAFEGVNLRIQATKKLYLDGGSDTYITENAGNNLQFVVGSNQKLVLGNSSSTHNQHFKLTDSSELQLGTDADVQLQHTGTHMYFDNKTGDMNFRQKNENNDIIFQGNDGGGNDTSVNITALTLDMSEAGKAIFNADVTAGGKISGANLLVTGGSVSNTNGVQLAYSSNYAVAQLNGVTGSFIDFSDSSTDYKGRIIYTNSNNKFKFYTNATQALEIDSSQNATIAGDLTISGGGITLSGTGQIQGIDTVNNATDAANKQYVDTKKQSIIIACSDETSNLTTGTAKTTFRMPYAFTLAAVRASVTTAPEGSTIIVDINQAGSSILSTKLSIDAGEKTSTTAADAAVISTDGLDDDAEITIDIDQIGSSTAGTGLKVSLIGVGP